MTNALYYGDNLAVLRELIRGLPSPLTLSLSNGMSRKALPF